MESKKEHGEEKLAASGWRVRAGPSYKPTLKERDEHEAAHVPFRDWCTHCMMGAGHHHHVQERGSVEETHHCGGL